ncbi:MAG: hypothetical protein HRF50_07380 [Phycisphaerae bacterium]|jgi:hypothetical protein
MPIELHCDHCGKLVRAPDDAGGKRGVCPSCHQSVYIPTPSEQLEPLTIEPVDKNAERERQRLLRESHDLVNRVLHEREAPGDAQRGRSSAPSAPSAPARTPGGPAPTPGAAPPPPVDVRKLIIQYARAMADGELAVADRLAQHIRRDMKKAEDVMQEITLDELPPAEIANVPRPVLVGFFKTLRGG